MTEFVKLMIALTGVFALGNMTGCAFAQSNEKPAITAPQKGDYLAVVFFDCNEMKSVVFMSFQGEFQQVQIGSSAQLFDVQLRLSHVNYDFVQYIINNRPCGFAMDENDKIVISDAPPL